MNKPFELAEDGKVRIVGVVIRDNAQVLIYSGLEPTPVLIAS